jgi:hypothetical protein
MHDSLSLARIALYNLIIYFHTHELLLDRGNGYTARVLELELG